MNTPLKKTGYSKFRVGQVRLNLAEGVCLEWAEQLVALVAQKKIGGVGHYPAPPGWSGKTVLKVYRRRPKHHLLRLLSASRATLEGAGYLAFMERGLLVPTLVLWGEERRHGLFEFGLVVTLWVDAPSIAEAYALSQEAELLFATAEELAVIHKAGLAHGDPYARNFLATRPRPMPLDVTSWSRFGKASQIKDLTRFACSVIKLTNDLNQAKAVLRHYERFGLPLPVSVDELLNRAIAYAQVKKIRP